MPFNGTDLSRSVGIIEDSDRKTPTLDMFYGDNADNVRPVDVVTDSDDDNTNETRPTEKLYFS